MSATETFAEGTGKGAAIVTGAARGIGRAIALRLAADGFALVVSDLHINTDALHEVVLTIENGGGRADAVTGDVSVEADVVRLVDQAVEQFGVLDVMVANAGIPLNKPLASTSVDEWDRLFAVNARGVFLCYKHAAARMIAQGRGGRLIGIPEAATYCATKFAVRGLTQSAALEYGPHGITVNAYAPGAIETPFLGQFDTYHTAKSGAAPGSWSDSLKEKAAVRDNGTPADVAALVSYLASREARFVTGQSVLVDGGTVFD